MTGQEEKDLIPLTLAGRNPRLNWTKEDFYAEQLFDGDCNNCKFVDRSVSFEAQEKSERLVFGLPAMCTKFNRKVRTFSQPGIYSGHPCFVHIRTGLASMEPDPNPLEQPRFMDAEPEVVQ